MRRVYLSALLLLFGVAFLLQSRTADMEAPYSRPEEFQFASAEKAREWMQKHYKTHQVVEKVFADRRKTATLLSMYGLNGSGVIRADAYFLACESEGCSMIGAKMGTETADMQGPASVELVGQNLVIESHGNFRFEYKLN